MAIAAGHEACPAASCFLGGSAASRQRRRNPWLVTLPPDHANPAPCDFPASADRCCEATSGIQDPASIIGPPRLVALVGVP